MLVLVGLLVFLVLPIYWRWVATRHRPLFFCFLGWSVLLWYEPRSLLLLLALTLAVHALALGGSPPGRTRVAVVVVLAVLGAQKVLALQGVVLVGFSYACFRLLHAAFDHAAGRLAPPGRVNFVAYALFPAYFLSGPIARYQEHMGGAEVDGLSLDDALVATTRILGGLMKKVMVAAPLLRVADSSFADPGGGPLMAWVGLLAYSIGLYADFSGYSDVALGVARLFGFRGPENFDWPYLASDIGDFWKRWHITLSSWLRDYLFLPLTGHLAGIGWFRRNPLALGSSTSIATMVACGLWHGLTPSFLLWGLGHGAMIALHQFYRQRVLSRLSASRRKPLLDSAVYRGAATALTFLTVSLLWTFFKLPPAEAVRFLWRLLGP